MNNTTVYVVTDADVIDSYHFPLLNTDFALPVWQACLILTILPLIIVATLVGNVLVTISVFTSPQLNITPNYFIVSLAMADITVAIFVLPLNVMYNLKDR